MSDLVIIEAAINGATSKTVNPNVPVTEDEIVADALACFETGAATVHQHITGFNLSGEEAAQVDLGIWRRVLAERPDALWYPTINLGPQAQWYDHIPPSPSLSGRAAGSRFRQRVRGELVLDTSDACSELQDQTGSQTPQSDVLVLVYKGQRGPITRARLAHRFRCYSSRCRSGISVRIDHRSSGLRQEGARKRQGRRKNQMRWFSTGAEATKPWCLMTC
jgi:beta-keto acid cleavage enzyme